MGLRLPLRLCLGSLLVSAVLGLVPSPTPPSRSCIRSRASACCHRAVALSACAEADAAAASAVPSLPRVRVRAPRRLQYSAPADGRGAASGLRRGGSSPLKPEVGQQGVSRARRDLQRLTITGGVARGRRIKTPDAFLRPMMARVRIGARSSLAERAAGTSTDDGGRFSQVRGALFSMLAPSGVLRDDASHLDLFAGAGTIGLEALSRGIGRVTFCDLSPRCGEEMRLRARLPTQPQPADRSPTAPPRHRCTRTIRENLEAVGCARPSSLLPHLLSLRDARPPAADERLQWQFTLDFR